MIGTICWKYLNEDPCESRDLSGAGDLQDYRDVMQGLLKESVFDYQVDKLRPADNKPLKAMGWHV